MPVFNIILFFLVSALACMVSASPGKQLYQQHCAGCHEDPAVKAPRPAAMAQVDAATIMMAMEFGRMQPQAAHLTKAEKVLIAAHLSPQDPAVDEWMQTHQCEGNTATLTKGSPIISGNWGQGGHHNRRYMNAASSGIDRQSIKQLDMAWSLALPKVVDMRSQPVLTENTLYVGTKRGDLFALHAKSGCIQWHTKVLGPVRSGLVLTDTPNGRLLFFGDALSQMYAVDAYTGKIRWRKDVSLFPTSIITGTPTYYDGRIYVPVSSYEVAAAGMAQYPCCRSHGAVVALDAQSGESVWQWHATAQAQPRGKNSAGVMRWGPSGGSVWTTPTIDADRGLLYIGTSENLSPPATDMSDAVVAIDMDTGKTRWFFQALAGDIWNGACLNGGVNCPEQAGPDFDFGASIILAKNRQGNDILLAGQKSGEVFALDPDRKGTILWRRRLSQGTTNGGIHWGMALSGQTLLVPIADPERNKPDYTPRPGLSALDINTGEVRWHSPVSRDCQFDYSQTPKIGLEQMRSGAQADLAQQYCCSFYYGLSSAASATDDIVFSGALDGRLRAWDIETGQVLWQYATARPVAASNGVQGHGGAIDVAGVIMGQGYVYVLSGYSLFGQLPGNLLLAFKTGPVPEPESTAKK